MFLTISSISASIVWYDGSVSSGDAVCARAADGSTASNAHSDTAYE
ncbi:hypothetical protein QP175_07625 [Sphingomonas aerolata]